MIYGHGSVRFLLPLWSFHPHSQCLRFLGNTGAIHLQQTGLFIEGDYLRVSMPFLNFLLRISFCEWSTYTIPYSRIRRFREQRHHGPRLLAWLIAGVLACAALCIVNVNASGVQLRGLPTSLATLVQVEPLSVVGAAVLFVSVGLALRWIARPRHVLEFLGGDGRPLRMCLRFTSRKEGQNFAEQLQGYREEVFSMPGASVSASPHPAPRQHTEESLLQITAAWFVVAFLVLCFSIDLLVIVWPDVALREAVHLLLFLFILVGPPILIHTTYADQVATQARFRGYSYLLWFVVGLGLVSPLLLLGMMVLLPDVRRLQLRREESKALEKRLAFQNQETTFTTGTEGSTGITQSLPATNSPPPSIGDVQTAE